MTFGTVPAGDGVPPEPDWASLYADELDIAAAHEAWGVVVREMREVGTLAVTNGHAVRRLVEFRVQFDRASRQVAEQGPILKAKRTRVPQYNPHWTIMRQADEAIRVLEAELGLAPTRRAKAAKVEKKAKAARAADSFLKPVGKTG